jgi:hypothetical protein
MYAKVFASLWQGSLYGQSGAQMVFIYLLAHADQDGHVRVVARAMADAIGISESEVDAAIAVLEGPDPKSGSPELDGRRLEQVSNGRWFIVNYKKYRGMRDLNERRQQNLEAQRRKRSRNSVSATVSHGQPPSSQAEVEVEVEVKEPKPSPSPDGSGGVDKAGWTQAFEEDFWPLYPKKPEKAKALLEWVKITPKTDDTFTEVMRGLRDWNRLWAQPSTPDHFIPSPPYAHKWLKTRRWEADPS